MGLTAAAGGWFPAPAAAAPAAFGSPAWFAQPHTNPGTSTSTAPSSGIPGRVRSPQQVLQDQQMQRSMADLNAAAAAITAAQGFQSAQHQLALDATCKAGVNCVMDGITDANNPARAGYLPGLQVDTPSQWVGVSTDAATGNKYVQTVANGKTTVTITQNQQKAILDWKSFNVGRNTTVDFNQSAGNQSDGSNDWIALNRVDAGAHPTQILGNIKADGTVYLIDPNGIIFGGSSQINVHSLLASTLNLYSNDLTTSNNLFLSQGIAQNNGALLVSPVDRQGNPNAGNIEIDAGASISTGHLGYSLIAAPELANAGSITATDGQIVLAAGTQINSSLTSPTAVDLNVYVASVTPGGQTAPAVVNTGLIQSHRGDITLLGAQVEQGQGGVIEATTGISAAGKITVLAADGASSADLSSGLPSQAGYAVFAPGSVTAVLPEEDGQTTTSGASATAAFQQVLAQGGVNIAGGSVTFQKGSLVEAPGSKVSVRALQAQASVIPVQADIASYGRIYLDNGATIDVAGLVGDSDHTRLTEAMAANLVTIAHLGGNELADSPLQRDGILNHQSITVDIRDSGQRSDGLKWIGTPLANVQGYVEQVPQTIDSLLVNAGSISLKGQEVITQVGSMLNLAGGYIHYLGGNVDTTRLVGTDGRVYDISNADPNIAYVSFAGQYAQSHARWNVTTSFVNPLLKESGSYESDYVQGGNAGALNIVLDAPGAFSPVQTQTAILDGAIDAEAIAGRHQVMADSASAMPQGGSFSISAAASDDGAPSAVSFVIAGHAPGLDSLINPGCTADCTPFTAGSSLPGRATQDPTDPGSVSYWTTIPALTLEGAGFSKISVDAREGVQGSTPGTTDGQILVNSALSVQPGGTISLTAAKVTIDADLTAMAGSIAVTSTGATALPAQTAGSIPSPAITYTAGDAGDIVIGEGVTLSTRGQWVNDAGLTPDQQTGGATINGGTISLTTETDVVTVANNQTVETTGSILFGTGSLLDVSSGGRVLPNGTLASANGVPLGQGGNVSLVTYALPPGGTSAIIGSLPSGESLSIGHIGTGDGSTLASHLRALGFTGGGNLTLQAISFQVGGDPTCSGEGCTITYLPTDFFSGQGFHSYTLRSETGSSIEQKVDLSGDNLLPNIGALLFAPTNADLYAKDALNPDGIFASMGQLDTYHRAPTNLTFLTGLAFSDAANGAGIIASKPANTYNYFADQDGTLTIGLVTDPSNPDQVLPTINADAGANITLGSKFQVSLLGEIVDRGGNVTLTGDTASNGFYGGYSSALLLNDAVLDPYTRRDAVTGNAIASVWLGSQSVIDVHGVAIANPLQGPVTVDGKVFTPTTGKVLNGGNVVLSDDSGYVIAQKGAVIDVSGIATDQFYVPSGDTATGSLTNPHYVNKALWSNAGSITIGASAGLLFDATLKAQAGAPQAEGGSLTLSTLNQALTHAGGSGGNTPGLILQQSGYFAPEGLAPGVDPTTLDTSLKPNTLYFAADRLTGSGITTLTVGSRSDITPAPNFTPVVIGLVGGLDLDLGRAFIANASDYRSLPGATDAAAPASGCGSSTAVCITAPYVQLAGYYDDAQTRGVAFQPPSYTPAPSDTVLNINATALLDIGGTFQIQDFGQTHFTSNNGRGDIRFYTPAAHDYPAGTTSPAAGVLFSNGDLSFDAGQLYPATGNTFIVEAGAAGSTITFTSAGAGASPLSAGGTLLVDAANIIQDGTLRAPSGSIVLGVGKADDPATQALFNDCAQGAVFCLPLQLVATQNVELGAGSLTSVSLDGLKVPYGTTIDGQNWNYNGDPLAGAAVANLNAPPAKTITLNGANVAVDAATNGQAQAVIDLSGGGQLMAQEWIPGTGGTRNVLLQNAVTYTTQSNGNVTSSLVPQYADGRAIYAIVPDFDGVAAPYDPAMWQGQGTLAIGQQIQLSGAPGLKAGTYTLLPAQYATLPGAYRVVVDANSTDAVAARNTVLADGTLRVAGYFMDGLTGDYNSARSVAFLVQSSRVWQQYSQFALTEADTFFATQAQHAGAVAPLLPRDAGDLVLSASSSLTLNGKLDAQVASGGSGARVDIASQNIDITGSSQTAPDGYVQISAQQLDNLGASSILIGGSRTRTAAGDQIDVVSSNVIVDNGGGASDALYAPEVILVARGNGDGSNSGISVTAGSVIAARGSIAAGQDVPITLGSLASGQGLNDDVAGDGALLRVSNGSAVTINRLDLKGAGDPVLLNIASGATIGSADTAAVTLDSSASTVIGPSATISAKAIDADSSAITFTAGDGVSAPGLVITPELLASLGAAQSLTLRSRSTLDFISGGNGLSVDLGSSNLTLSAGAFRSDGGTVSISASTLGIDNELGASTSAASLGGSAAELSLQGKEIDFGPGSTSLAAFGSVNAAATGGIAGTGSGTVDFGAANVTLATPIVIADQAANTTLKTSGDFSVEGLAGGTALSSTAIGGSLTLHGGRSLTVDTAVQALAGKVTLDATAGDLALGSGANVSVQGVAEPFFDVIEYASGGSIALQAENGNVNVASGATLNFSGYVGDATHAGGGNAGSLSVSALGSGSNVALDGTLDGQAASGLLGGSFSLDSAGAVDLDALAAQLAAGGIDNVIAVHSHSGNLTLDSGSTLTGTAVSLTADGGDGVQNANAGNVIVDGTIAASGDSGGSISLYGKSGVDVEGVLSSTSTGSHGGIITLGTAGVSDGTLDATYGYENVTAAGSGTLTIGASAKISFVGGSGGTLYLRAPLLVAGNDDQHDVNVDLSNRASFSGVDTVKLEAYATWSTADLSKQADPSKAFDGIIDPAGIYDSNGNLVAGTFYNAKGQVVASGGNLQDDFFVPDAGAVNTAHKDFYQTTLMGFVQNLDLSYRFAQSIGANASLKGAKVDTAPGIELVNPAGSGVNGGNITVASNWNLGASNWDPARGADNSNIQYFYRYRNQFAPVLTLRSGGNIDIDASISDGFTQTADPTSLFHLHDPAYVDNSASPIATWQNPLPIVSANLDGAIDVNGAEVALDSSSYRFVAGADVAASDPLGLLATAQQSAAGSIIFDGYTKALFGSYPVYAPTMVRTGTGSIEMAAAGDLVLSDPTGQLDSNQAAPGVIYSAGQRNSGITSSTALLLTNFELDILNGLGNAGDVFIDQDVVITGAVNPVNGGNVSINVGRNIQGVENFDTLWWPWTQTTYHADASRTEVASSINYGGFSQGILSAGGNIDIAAGGNISDLSVSLPTTWNLQQSTGSAPIGGGDLSVTAGGDILSGSYFVSNGVARIVAGGSIGADLTKLDYDINLMPTSVPLSTLFALQFGQFDVSATGSIDVGGVLNPSYYQYWNLNQGLTVYPKADFQSYGPSSAFVAQALTGNLTFDSLPDSFSFIAANQVAPDILPATIELSALNGAISIDKAGELYPSASGELSVVSAGSIRFSAGAQVYNELGYPQFTNATSFGLIDADASLLPSPQNPANDLAIADFLLSVNDPSYALHTATPLHAQDAVPVYVYSLSGDVVDGNNDSGFPGQVLNLVVDKPASIQAGEDIVNLSFLGQNLYDSDVTRIVAGRDLYDTPYPENPNATPPSTLLQLGGGGTFDIEAGRDIGPLTSANQNANNYIQGLPGAGILSIGNQFNPYLPHAGANIVATFGTAKGIDLKDFEATYIDPSSSVAGIPGYGDQLVKFVEQYNADCAARGGQSCGATRLTAAQAWAEFSDPAQMPAHEQKQFVFAVYFDILNQTGLDYNNPESPYYQQYSRGYAAIDTLFPASYGYTANNLGKGANGAQALVQTGNLDMRGSTIQTEQGGDISILGPGGSVLVGSASAVPFVVGAGGVDKAIAPNLQGILTEEQGNIDIFSDSSVLLAQSRIFTEQGGDILMWSSNGDINAGKGARTTSELPPPEYFCTPDHYCRVDAKGQVSGAGIATLQTVPGSKDGSVNLIAPVGTVDAGDAGIRVSGNVNIAAQHVANAENIQVQGQASGIPSSAVDAGALGAASAAAAAADKSAEAMAAAQPVEAAATVITVEVVGYGAPNDEEKKRLRRGGV